MKKEKLLKVLRAPHLSEKASAVTGQYVFEVARTANKMDVKLSVEEMFQVKVKSVNIVNVKGATINRSGRAKGQQSSWKKAYVVLKVGQQINIA